MDKWLVNRRIACKMLCAVIWMAVIWNLSGITAFCKSTDFKESTAFFEIGAFTEGTTFKEISAFQQEYRNDETGYQVIIEDDANLLSEQEEETLAGIMKDITDYGNVAFKSIGYNEYSTEQYIKNYYNEMFGSKSGTVFLVDMDNRNIWIHSNGGIYRVITNSYADTITDNIYRYASEGKYFLCSKEAFSQILTLLQGSRIAQPMKYISNVLLSVILGLLITYFVVRTMSMAGKPSDKELLEATRYQYRLNNPQAVHTGTTKRYDPPSSGGGSGGGGGSSGGGGGGGGGGHRF